MYASTTTTIAAAATLEEEKNKFENYLLFVRTECQKNNRA